MHEFSIMVDIVEAALKSMENYEVEKVKLVFLDVGELTFLNPEQLQFSFKVLTQDNVLRGADLVIEEKKAQIGCLSCDYKGTLINEPEGNHFGLISITCPKCGGKVEILSGRECILRRVHLDLRDENINGGGDNTGN